MTIVTKKGDTGQTSLASGERVSKSHERIEAVGTLDELVSFLGLARSNCKNKIISAHLKKIQSGLFLVGTQLASSQICSGTLQGATNDGGLKPAATIIELDLTYIETLIAKYEPPLKGFIIPGDSKESALLDVARTVCRRLERRVVALKEAGLFENDTVLKYINRLSDLLWIFARNL